MFDKISSEFRGLKSWPRSLPCSPCEDAIPLPTSKYSTAPPASTNIIWLHQLIVWYQEDLGRKPVSTYTTRKSACILRPRPPTWIGIATGLLGHGLQSAMYHLPSPTSVYIFSASFTAGVRRGYPILNSLLFVEEQIIWGLRESLRKSSALYTEEINSRCRGCGHQRGTAPRPLFWGTVINIKCHRRPPTLPINLPAILMTATAAASAAISVALTENFC